MQIEVLVPVILLGVAVLGGLISIIIAIIRGDMKKFIEEKMCEAEKLELTGEQKLAYVLKAVKEKYKLVEWLLNCKKFIKHIIKLTKQINVK